jgi:formate hydrogenlyase subunit 5
MLKDIINELEKDYGTRSIQTNTGESEYFSTDPPRMLDISAWLQSKGLSLSVAFGAESFRASGLSIIYAFEYPGETRFLSIVTELSGNEAVSIAEYFPNAVYFEREMSDGFGIRFSGSLDQRRLFRHEVYPPDFHPLLKSFKNGALPLDHSRSSAEKYEFRPCEGEGVYQIPVGPVHAGIIEPGHFRFSAIGETICNLEIRHFYKHRGLEKLAEGKTAIECVPIAETVSGDESGANACAFSMAIERIAGVNVPPRAWELRTILLELERIYSHLGDLAGISVDVAFPTGAAPFFNLREEILRQNASLSGSRFSKGIIVPGGLAKDIPQSKITELHLYLNTFVGRLEAAVEEIESSSWVIDRFETTGVIKPELVAPLGLSGPAARASGSARDTRMDHPYGLYLSLRLETYTRREGDVLARFHVKADEVKNSVRMIQDVIERMGSGHASIPCLGRDGFAFGAVEAARGQNLHWVYIKNGIIRRYKVRTASFCNWPAIEHAVLGNIVADFPLINKSLNLSYAGNDL